MRIQHFVTCFCIWIGLFSLSIDVSAAEHCTDNVVGRNIDLPRQKSCKRCGSGTLDDKEKLEEPGSRPSPYDIPGAEYE